MADTSLAPTAKVELLIRRPVAEVFGALTRAETLTKFWLSRASGPLELGRRVHWDFMVQGASVETFVREIEKDRRILVDWSDGTTVEWRLTPQTATSTVISVENAGFEGDRDEAMATALEATQGFTIVLCDLKLLLETGASPNLVRDKAALIEASAARA